MTGMGDDGARGMTEMHQTRAYCVAQDEETCLVYGMPKEAVKHGAIDKIMPLPGIPQTSIHALEKATKASKPPAKVG